MEFQQLSTVFIKNHWAGVQTKDSGRGRQSQECSLSASVECIPNRKNYLKLTNIISGQI